MSDIYVILSKGFRLGLDVVVKMEYELPINFTLITKESKKIVTFNFMNF